MASIAGSVPSHADDEVSLFRLYVLRAMYLVLVVGLGAMIVPELVNHELTSRGVIASLLGAVWLLAIFLNNSVLTRLQKIVETVRHGDAFIPDNAYRLNAIAWLVLALQLISIVIGAIGSFLSTPQNPLDFDAGFSPTSWLCVLLLFVLARVFAEGTLMREDLEGTI